MSQGDASFELEPPESTPDADSAADAAPAPRRSRLVGRRRNEPSPPVDAPQPPQTWPQRLLSPLVSPTGYYLIGFLLLLLALLSLFNPRFGTVANYWPHEILGLGSLSLVWDSATVRALCLVVVILGYIVALLMRPGVARGVVIAFVTFVAFVTFQPAPAHIRFYVLPIALALTAGALIARTQPNQEGARKAVLLVGFTLVAAHLFMPWDSARVNQKQLQEGYYNTAIATIDYYANPPEIIVKPEGEEEAAGAATVYGNLFLLHAPATIACLMFLVALAALFGFGGRWARWAAGSLMVLMVFSWALANFLHGRGDPTHGGFPAWQAGLRVLAQNWHENTIGYALPFAGAVAEMVRGRIQR